MTSVSLKHQCVFVGLSGGVDSSLTAWLLQKAGCDVVGVYLKNWTRDLGSWDCPWRSDYLAAKETASFLGIKFLVYDLQTSYRRLVVDRMIADYGRGQTPNPDINCNRQIKFKLFLALAQAAGADLVATGHYARTDGRSLFAGIDASKDQSYFLYSLNRSVLARVCWPLGNWTKSQVRARAAGLGLPSAGRADSQGICFVGPVGLADFLKTELDLAPGPIRDADSQQLLGHHSGAALFTIGQRRGLGVGSRVGRVGPYYVVAKDVAANTVYVSQRLDHPRLWSRRLYLSQSHWLGPRPDPAVSYLVRYHHLGRFYRARIRLEPDGQSRVDLEAAVRAAAVGQSVVVYEPGSDRIVGGGLISRTVNQTTTVAGV